MASQVFYDGVMDAPTRPVLPDQVEEESTTGVDSIFHICGAAFFGNMGSVLVEKARIELA